ncbi:hypothetical protein DC74_7534 [Streptomyces noursei]|uniref:Uncharacterized protein n=1 Tax=Streptomyces noursei TaxID=1971 RepID=A0A059W8Y6_STRNR|nr:hypothetical protein DC74_7534 [Streptomyces noursei]GCB95670.1 hypothetical protein SALB_08477 [Streptomyces noursei]
MPLNALAPSAVRVAGTPLKVIAPFAPWPGVTPERSRSAKAMSCWVAPLRVTSASMRPFVPAVTTFTSDTAMSKECSVERKRTAPRNATSVPCVAVS